MGLTLIDLRLSPDWDQDYFIFSNSWWEYIFLYVAKIRFLYPLNISLEGFGYSLGSRSDSAQLTYSIILFQPESLDPASAGGAEAELQPPPGIFCPRKPRLYPADGEHALSSWLQRGKLWLSSSIQSSWYKPGIRVFWIFLIKTVCLCLFSKIRCEMWDEWMQQPFEINTII